MEKDLGNLEERKDEFKNHYEELKAYQNIMSNFRKLELQKDRQDAIRKSIIVTMNQLPEDDESFIATKTNVT